MKSKSEANRQYKLKELHLTFPHFLWPDIYTKGLDYAYANLPVYQGALMFKDADLRKLSEELKKRPPSRGIMRQLGRKVDEAGRHVANMQALTQDREVMQKLVPLLEGFLDGTFKIPAEKEMVYRVHSTMGDAMWKIKYNESHFFRWKQVAGWWMQMLPPSLAEHFKIISDANGIYQLRISTVPFPGALVGQDGVCWAGCFTNKTSQDAINGLIMPYDGD
jgi:hypothetical protein